MKFKEFLSEMDPKLDYHDTLNPKIWEYREGHYFLKPEVKEHLIKIANSFGETLNLLGSIVIDYVFTGSNANYNWTSLSDIDVHLLLDPVRLNDCEACKSGLEDCLQAKKTLWNDRHDIKIYGFDVEVYATSEPENLVSDAGVYSLLEDRWIKEPERKIFTLDAEAVRVKAEALAVEIDQLVDAQTTEQHDVQELLGRIAKMRKAGLESGGEYSIENLTFKALRNNGYIDKIRNYSVSATDKELSLESLNSKIDYEVTVETNNRFKAKATINGREITASFSLDDDNFWIYEFTEGSNRTVKLTGSGGEFQVFSFIRELLEEFVQRYQPEGIKFSADKSDKGRAELYYKMLQKLKLPKYELEKDASPEDETLFRLVQK